ncbi:adenosylcobinamide-GDP ribazoletransferase [Gordonia sp. NPDC058843]|uniref:adenosylcobinamide-GDP ribazoletransferase n=1 Tax=Gordonia sp. NPDC058843 TaxID=3346648 RepID=UPI0036B1700A
MIPPTRTLRTAFSWLTIAPVGGHDTSAAPDRSLGAAVMAAVPVVGAVLGAASAIVAFGLAHTGLPMLMIGVLVVVLIAAATRGMHLDGLADTADGLGCYGPPERVTEVMRSGTVGPFGVATLVLTLAVQATGFAALADESRWYEIAFAIALGRLGAVIGTRRSLEPAHPNGFGALVAGTQRTSVVVWLLLALAATVPLGLSPNGFDGGHLEAATVVRGVMVVLCVAAFAWWFTRHCARRMGGMSGDVLGATIELGVALGVVGLLL